MESTAVGSSIHMLFTFSWKLGCVLIAWATLTTGLCSAQQLKFAKQQGPYYVGEPVLVQIVASGCQGSDVVSCRLRDAAPAGLTVEGPQVGQSSSSFVQVINGQMTRRETIDYRYNFVLTASRAGEYEVGPFEVTVNGKKETVLGEPFRFGELDPDPDMQIEFSLENDNIYLGQKVPLTIRWSFAGDIEQVQYAFSNLQIRSPLFDQFSFSDPPRRSRTTLTLATAKGGVEVDATVEQEQRDGQQVYVVTGQRTLIADSPGQFEMVPITCRTQKVTRWGRDLFGDRVARGTAPALAVGKPLSFNIRPIPVSNRPRSFAGAVGNGFSIEVAANRSVVRVGDPISLTVTVRGDGNLDAISLPSLASQMGLPETDFQSPTERLSGTIDGNSKQFKVNVRVKNQNVTQIPPLAFSWFDPQLEAFATAESKPIALQVMETKIVSSADVVANPRKDTNGNGGKGDRDSMAAPPSSISFAGANLAIETNPARLLSHSQPGQWRRYLAPAIYIGAILLAVVALVRGRRSAESVAKSRKRNRLNHLRKTIRRASSLAGKQAYGQIANTLRDYIREFEPSGRSVLDDIISDCDNAIYAHADASDRSRIADLVQRSLSAMKGEAKP